MVPPFLAFYGLTTNNQSMLQEAYTQVCLGSFHCERQVMTQMDEIDQVVSQLPLRSLGKWSVAARGDGRKWDRPRALVDWYLITLDT